MTRLKRLLMTTLLTTTLTAHAEPIVNLFELGVQADKTTEFDNIGHFNISESVTGERGTLAMYAFKQRQNPNMAYMFEIYQDNDSYQTHLHSPQYQLFIKNSPNILTEHKRKIDVIPQFLGDKKVIQTSQTINNLVIVDVKAEDNAKFREIVIPEMAKSLQVENGVLAMYAVTEKANPNRWYFYEIYENESAYQTHRLTSHFKDYLEQSKELIDDKQAVAITPSILLNKGNLNFLSQNNE